MPDQSEPTAHANGGVEIEGDGDVVTVRMICEGCGELVSEEEVFADQAEGMQDLQPIHDSVVCMKKASAELENHE